MKNDKDTIKKDNDFNEVIKGLKGDEEPKAISQFNGVPPKKVERLKKSGIRKKSWDGSNYYGYYG